MMSLQSWHEMISWEDQHNYLTSELWRGCPDEWVWELAIVDEEMIVKLFGAMELSVQDVLLELLATGILLIPTAELQLIEHLSKTTSRPKYQCRRALMQLSDSGIIFMLRDPWHGELWLMPLPILQNWRKHIILNHLQWIPVELPESAAPSVHYASVVPLHVQLIFFMKKLSTSSVKLTKEGRLSKVLHKTLKKQIDDLWSYEAIERMWLQHLSGAGDIVYFYLELATDLGLLDIEGQHLVINEEKLHQWLSLSQSIQGMLLWQWLNELILQSRQYVEPIMDINDCMHNATKWNCFTNERNHLLVELLELFAQCGFISFYVGDHIYICGEVTATSNEKLHVEQNGEIVLLPGVMPKLLWNVLSIAELTSLQQVIILKLSIAVLQQQPCASPEDFTRIRQWLAAHCEEELPAIVEQWLNASEATMSWESERLEYTMLFFDDIGQQAFFCMRSIIGWGKYCSHPLGGYRELKPVEPSLVAEHLQIRVMGLDRLARSWKEELRSYHHSTTREILETAIQFGLSSFIIVNGQKAHIIPDRTEDSDGKGNVHARLFKQPHAEAITLPIEQIEGIQLFVD